MGHCESITSRLQAGKGNGTVRRSCYHRLMGVQTRDTRGVQDGFVSPLVPLDVRFVPPAEDPRSITLFHRRSPSRVRRPSLCWAACSTSRGGRMHTGASIWPHFHARGHACFYILGPSITRRETMHGASCAQRVASEYRAGKRMNGWRGRRTSWRQWPMDGRSVG